MYVTYCISFNKDLGIDVTKITKLKKLDCTSKMPSSKGLLKAFKANTKLPSCRLAEKRAPREVQKAKGRKGDQSRPSGGIVGKRERCVWDDWDVSGSQNHF